MLDTNEVRWSVPATILPSTLDGDIRIIANFLLDPVDPNGKSASELLRKKRKAPKKRRRAVLADDDLDGLDGLDEDEVPKKARQKKRKEEVEAYKSAQFVRFLFFRELLLHRWGLTGSFWVFPHTDC